LFNHVVRVAPGWKRIILTLCYLENLYRPNVTLSYDAIERIVPQEVRLKTGEFNELILGTGFSLVRHSSNENRAHGPSPGDLCPSAFRLLEIKGWPRGLLWARGAERSQLLHASRYVWSTGPVVPMRQI
jgi:hypothetical protein